MRKVGAALAICLLAGVAWAATPEEIVDHRQSVMKQMGHIGKAFKAAVRTNADLAPLVPQADTLAGLGGDIAAMFPAGTDEVGDTEALMYVWSNRADFEARSAKFAADVAAFAKLGHATQFDQAAFAAQWDTLTNECGSCHINFKHD